MPFGGESDFFQRWVFIPNAFGLRGRPGGIFFKAVEVGLDLPTRSASVS